MSYQSLKAGTYFAVSGISPISFYESSFFILKIEKLPSSADKLYVMNLSKNLEECQDKAEVSLILIAIRLP